MGRRSSAWGPGLAAAFALAACAGATEEPPRVATVVTIDARTVPEGEVVELHALARLGGYHSEPLEDDAARPVRLVEVLDVDELLLETDRGRERVRLDGLVGQHPAWPDAANSWFAREGRAALESWLAEPGHENCYRGEEMSPKKAITIKQICYLMQLPR